LTSRFQFYKKQINQSIVAMYRECKEICKAAEKGDEDINLDHLIADFKDETATNTAEVKGSPD